MKIAIPIKYEKGYFESHFKMMDNTICEMDRLSYIYDNLGERYLCMTTTDIYNDGQASITTKDIEVFNDNLNQIKIEGRVFFIYIEVTK